MTANSRPGKTGKPSRRAKRPAEPPADESARPEAEAPFPVVALGASAGGLEALSSFFSELPPVTGMAFLVVQHLSPTQGSMLSELLGKAAHLSVVEAEDGVVLAPEHAYVIPPNRYLGLNDGRLRLEMPEPSEHPRLSVNHLFFALAAELEDRAVAVVLSGTGMDGTEGIKAIKNHGGLTVAQDPRTARYGGMPESAIASGHVDLILSPEKMGQELVRYMRLREGTSAREQAMPAGQRVQWIAPILAYLRQVKGHDFSQYKTKTIMRRLGRRMAVHNIDSVARYAQFLKDNPGEADILMQEFLIRVSRFFRDPAAFKVLEDEVIPALFEGRGLERPVRVWIPGCSTGEEAYSIAMLLDEQMNALKKDYRIQIFATDIDSTALEVARAGRYPASIEADVSPDRLRRFFTRQDGFYQINKPLRDMLVFAEQSLIKDPPFSRMDLVSCRNVLIYLQTDLQKRVLALFHYALNPDGFLFLGTSETISGMDDYFVPLRRDTKAYRRVNVSSPQGRRIGPLFLPDPAASRKPVSGSVSSGGSLNFSAIIEKALLRDHTPPCVVVNARNEIVYFHGRTGRFLEAPPGAPTTDVVQMARPALNSALRTALHQVRARGQTIHTGAAQADGGLIRVTAAPLNEPSAPPGMVLLLVQDVEGEKSEGSTQYVSGESDPDTRIRGLQLELHETKEALQATIEEVETANEELQSSNEELQSSNEELQSSNEELETSREELQSVNEELHTVNAELELKVEELSRINDDMNNLLASTAVGLIFLDRELRIQRFTPAATEIVPLIAGDIGRPLANISLDLKDGDLVDDLRHVVQDLATREREVCTSEGKWYLLKMRPYHTSDNRVGGAVLAFADITDTVRLRTARKLAGALDACPTMALVLDTDGCVQYANAAFAEATGQAVDPSRPKPLEEFGVKPVAAKEWQNGWRTLLGGGTWSGTMELPMADGQSVRATTTAAGIVAEGRAASCVALYFGPLE